MGCTSYEPRPATLANSTNGKESLFSSSPISDAASIPLCNHSDCGNNQSPQNEKTAQWNQKDHIHPKAFHRDILNASRPAYKKQAPARSNFPHNTASDISN